MEGRGANLCSTSIKNFITILANSIFDLAGARRVATGLSRRVSLKVTRVVVRGRLKKRRRGGAFRKNVIFAPNATLREAKKL